MKRVSAILLLLLMFMTLPVSAQWLKTSGKKIVNENGNEFILRGMGLGGWMLQEGYMMQSSSFANTQHELKAKIESLIGSASTEEFYSSWRHNHLTKGDVDSLASWGFNSVRLPMHYNLFTLPIEQEPVAGENTWLTEGFALTDSLVKWCAANHMYVILDLHAAPGGQGRDLAICDGDASKPSLWESQANKQKTIALWKKLAERYVNEPWIGAYDILNEPNWNFSGTNQNGCDESSNIPLKQLLVDITTAIRQVDKKHIIIIEGNCWGNNYNGIAPTWDNNLAVSYHKYWSNNDLGSIQGILNMRNTYNVPAWLGESGENSNQWFTDAIRLLEENGIGWAWWPLKKIGSVVNPLTIPKDHDYGVLLDYWTNGGTKPTAEFARNALMRQAANANIANCIYRKDVTDAMFRQVHDTTTVPFFAHHVPGVIHATDYDLGENGRAYFDTDYADYHVSSGTYTAWNSGYTYRNDGVDIENSTDTDPNSNGYNIGWTATGEWMQYTIDVDSTAAYNVQVRYAVPPGSLSKVRIRINGADVTESVSLQSTGGNQVWQYAVISDAVLYKGKQKLQLYFERGGANLGFLKFTLGKPLSEITLKPVSAQTIDESQLIGFTCNKLLSPASVSATGFAFTVNSNAVAISSAAINPDNNRQIVFTLSQAIFDGDLIFMDYSGGTVVSDDDLPLEAFTYLKVINNLPVHQVIPGKIEAESFFNNKGLQLENCSDAGNGQNIGYTNTGDYVDYRIRVRKTADYKLEVRESCLNNAGKISVQQLDETGALLNSATMDIPVTGGWQTWNTASASIRLNEGIGVLRVLILQPEFNLNWYLFNEIVHDTVINEDKEIKIYPNPTREKLNIDIPKSKGQKKKLSIHSVSGRLVHEENLKEADETYETEIGSLGSGMYIVELQVAGNVWRSKLMVE